MSKKTMFIAEITTRVRTVAKISSHVKVMVITIRNLGEKLVSNFSKEWGEESSELRE